MSELLFIPDRVFYEVWRVYNVDTCTYLGEILCDKWFPVCEFLFQDEQQQIDDFVQKNKIRYQVVA